MSRYCSDAIAIAQVAAVMKERGDGKLVIAVNLAKGVLDMAERELRHNGEHLEMPPDQEGGSFDVPKGTK